AASLGLQRSHWLSASRAVFSFSGAAQPSQPRTLPKRAAPLNVLMHCRQLRRSGRLFEIRPDLLARRTQLFEVLLRQPFAGQPPHLVSAIDHAGPDGVGLFSGANPFLAAVVRT